MANQNQKNADAIDPARGPASDTLPAGSRKNAAGWNRSGQGTAEQGGHENNASGDVTGLKSGHRAFHDGLLTPQSVVGVDSSGRAPGATPNKVDNADPRASGFEDGAHTFSTSPNGGNGPGKQEGTQ